MAIKRTWKLVVLLILFPLILTGCTEEDCLSDNSSLFFINFETSDKKPALQTFTTIVISGISSPFQGGAATARFFLPINPHADRTTFTFKTENTTEQITFSYTRRPQILSAECPYEILFENLVIEESTFTGDVKLLKSNLSNSDIPNVTISR